MRCDLHVHSRHSGHDGLPGFLHGFGRECYSDPAAVAAVARARGMHLVTLTDHDSIEGALTLMGSADAFLSEEVTCRLPGGAVVHVGVYGIEERDHAEIASRRDDGERLFAYLAERRIPAALNHPFSALTGERRPQDLLRAFHALPLVETRNGLMSRQLNHGARVVARALRRGEVGGSDAHTLASVARAFTEVEGARDREDFLCGLRLRLGVPRGAAGGYARLTADVARLVASGYAEALTLALRGPRELALTAAAVLALPLLTLLPLVTAAFAARDAAFALRELRALRGAVGRSRPLPRPGLGGAVLMPGGGR
jgi:predicted metal-dependent phosphoesterase TrpH